MIGLYSLYYHVLGLSIHTQRSNYCSELQARQRKSCLQLLVRGEDNNNNNNKKQTQNKCKVENEQPTTPWKLYNPLKLAYVFSGFHFT